MTSSPTTADAQQPALSNERAVHDPASLARFLITAVVFLALDLWSKFWVFANLDPYEVKGVIPGVLEFRRSLNSGAVFGSFEGMVGAFIIASLVALLFVFYLFAGSSRQQKVFHICLGLILAGAIGNLYDRAMMQADIVTLARADGSQTSRIGKIVAEDESEVKIGSFPDGQDVGTYRRSEIVDIHRQGVVRDFLKFIPRFPEWVPRFGGKDVWPWIFNVADAALVCGVILMLLCAWLGKQPLQVPQKKAE